MDKKDMMRKYELVLILDAHLGNEAKEEICKEVRDIVQKQGGKVINSQVWLEKHRMTFEIKKCKDGAYYLINYEGDPSVNAKIESVLRLNEKILRYAVLKGNHPAPVAAKSYSPAQK